MIEPDFGERLVVDRQVQQVRGQAAAGGAAGLNGLERAAVDDAAADVLDDLPQRHPHRDLDEPDVDHPAGQREHLRAPALLRAERGQPVGAVADDRGTFAKVSTLLISVGQPSRPAVAG